MGSRLAGPMPRIQSLLLVTVGSLFLAGCASNAPDASAQPDDMMVDDTTSDDMASGDAASDDMMMDASPLVQQLHGFFSDDPFLGPGSSTEAVPGGTPAHEWRKLSDGRLEYLHWDNADPANATKLLFVGDAVGPLMGCLGEGGVSQAQIDAGYNHFHKLRAASFAAGHHMDPNDARAMGYWLRHLDANDGSVFYGLDSTNLGAANPLKAC